MSGASFDALVREATLERELVAHEDVSSFVASLDPADAALASTVARAVRGAAGADRMGYAFVAGYFAALSGLGAGAALRGRFSARTAVAATEVSGVHPRNIAATLAVRDGIGTALRGDKTFVTLADQADTFLVVARDGRGVVDERGRAPLVAILVPKARDGVRVETKPPTPFAPEVPHARVRFEDVAIDDADVLPGDGWADWLKPFRTAEDTHVAAAAASYLLAVARRGGLLPAVASDLAQVVAVALVVEESGWSSASGHLALAGAFEALRRGFEKVVASLDEASPEKKRLARDALLLGVAETARQKRTEVALGRLTGPG
jgi:acyl-CoA dehydrogenase